MLKAIIFDFDGVIGDTYQINYDIAKEFDPNVNSQIFADHHMGNVFSEPKIKFQKTDIEPYFAKQKSAFTAGHIFPLDKILRQLNQKFQLFIISSTIDNNILHFLQLGKIDRLFQAILGSTTHRSKEVKFQMLFEKYHLRSDECLFVSDTVGDILEARKVGVDTIAVTWGYHSKDLLEQYSPLAIVQNPDELLEAIHKRSENV